MAFVPVTDSLGNPVLTSNGTQRVACTHLAEWLVTYDALQVARGRGHVTYYQTMGGADASAGTHNCGSAWDMAWLGDAAIADAREMGAAQWHRIPGRNGWPNSGADHCHGLIRCGDNGCNDYQYAAWLLGYNGLGLNGVGAGDPLPRPVNIRTWQQGVIWAHAEIARITGTASQEDDMPRLLLDTNGTGRLITGEGTIAVASVADAKVLKRILTAAEWDPNSAPADRVAAAEVDVYDRYVRAARGSMSATVAATVDPAVLTAAINTAVDAALSGVTFTTRKA